MLKKHKVVCLSTNQQSNITKSITSNKLYYSDNLERASLHNKHEGATYQHLYILSDEDIKEGVFDKVYFNTYDNSLWKYRPTPCALPYWGNLKTLKEIIATTDSSLGKLKKSEHHSGYIEYLPQPSNSFIEKFIERYNSGNTITDVMVEYMLGVTINDERQWENPSIEILKVNPKDNTITIKSVKDSWNREEVKELIYKFNLAISRGEIYNTPLLNKWIENNL